MKPFLLLFILTLISSYTSLPSPNLLLSSLKAFTAHVDPATGNTYYFDKELEPAILTGIATFLTYQSEDNLFTTYVLSDPECASVFQSYKSDIKILTTNYFGSGLAFAGLSIEEECYENSKNFLYVTYTPYISSNNTQNNTQTSVSLDEQVYRFLEQKNKTLGLCLPASCKRYYVEMLNMTKNTKFKNYLEEKQVRDVYLHRSLFNTTQLIKELEKGNKFGILNPLIWVVITYFIIRLLFTFIGYVMSGSFDEESIRDDEFDVKSLSKSEVGDWARESETLLTTPKQKQASKLIEFMTSLSFVDLFRKLFQLRSKLFDEKDIVLISGIRIIIFMFAVVAQNAYYMIKQPHKASAVMTLLQSHSFVFVKFSIYAFEGIKVLNGVLFGYKLISYIRKLNHRGESFTFKNMLLFYMKCLVYVISFIIIFFTTQTLFLEIGMKIKPSAHFEFFSKELEDDMECLRNKPYIFIPMYFQYFSEQIGVTNQTCFKTAFFTMSEFYCFTLIIIVTYIFLKLKLKHLETSFFIINLLLIIGAYFISIERSSIVGTKLTMQIVNGPMETLAMPHMFFLFYFVGFNIGIMFYFWVNLENVYTEYNDILVGKKTKLYLPFEYNLHLMKVFSNITQWKKTILAIIFALLLLVAPVLFHIRLLHMQGDIMIPRINDIDAIMYVYEPIIYSVMFSFCILFIMMSDQGSFILNFFRSKLFIGINRIFFACFNLFNFITQMFHGLYNADMYLSVTNIFECAFTITFLTLIVGIVFVLMIEVVLRIIFKMIFERNQTFTRTYSERVKKDGLFPDE